MLLLFWTIYTSSWLAWYGDTELCLSLQVMAPPYFCAWSCIVFSAVSSLYLQVDSQGQIFTFEWSFCIHCTETVSETLQAFQHQELEKLQESSNLDIWEDELPTNDTGGYITTRRPTPVTRASHLWNAILSHSGLTLSDLCELQTSDELFLWIEDLFSKRCTAS